MQAASYTVDLHELRDTERFARGLAEVVLAHPAFPLTIALEGSLGSGKTQWSRYFCGSLSIPETTVTSPTYVLLQRYVGARTVHHLDLYRLQSEAEAWDLGLDELLERPDITLIEWADRFPGCLPDDRLRIRLAPVGDYRRVTTSATGREPSQLLEQLVQHTAAHLNWRPMLSE